MRIIPALIFLAFLSGAAPAQAQQDVPMPRDIRVLVQKGLAFLGFDPGPADGVFGRRTRAAIWDWQAKNESETTGYLTQVEAETLTIAGMKAGQAQDREMEEPAGRLPVGADRKGEPRPNRPQHRVLRLPTCGEDKMPDGCWRELSSPAKCQIWLPGYHPSGLFGTGETVTWTGGCQYGLAHGRGTLEVAELRYTGAFVEGKRQGRWVIRGPDGTVSELDYVDDKIHGWEVLRYDDGAILRTPFVDGLRHGVSIFRGADGSKRETPFVSGKRHGREIIRTSKGTVIERHYKDGKEHGRTVLRSSDGTVWILPFVNGTAHGLAIKRYPYGSVTETPYVDGKKHGRKIDRWRDGSKIETPYVNDKKHGKQVFRKPDGTIKEVREFRNGNLVP